MNGLMRQLAYMVGLLALAAATGWAEELYFSRDFPGSGPAYFDVTLRADGAGGYREAPDEEPLDMSVDPETIAMLWGHVRALDTFARNVASERKVAFTGNKILRFTSDDGKQSESKFVYTEDPDAQALVSWFMKAGETARHRINLERAVRFDRLGVNDALLSLQSSMDRERVVAPEQLVPVLTQIVEQKRILHLARSRAAAMIEWIQAGSSASKE